MALVALALVAIVAMAALSIDIGTLYQAKAEAQRVADAAALAAARVISISGITGDPTSGAGDGSWSDICGGTSSPATLAAVSVAQQNPIAGAAIPSANVSVNYGTGSAGATTTNCTGAGAGFGINPVVGVTVTSAKLPIFFARVFSLLPGGNYSNTTVSATATAEAFNPSDSGTVASAMIPVQPRCVKPWIIPNIDPLRNPRRFVHLGSGALESPGVSQIGGGVIGETFNLNADCNSPGTPGNCALTNNPPGFVNNVLQYVPALISGTPGAVPLSASCSPTAGYQSVIAGCDQSTVYACGTRNGASYDLTENPVNPTAATGDTATAVECLINNANGRDLLTGYPAPPVFPFQIQAGSGNPLVKAGSVNASDIITTSNSIVTIPIYNSTPGVRLPPQITIIGFLQVFINIVDGATGNLNVTVLNVTGCSDDATNAPVRGTSPVPIRLITPP